MENLDIKIDGKQPFVFVIQQMKIIAEIVKNGHLKKLTIRTSEVRVASEMLWKIPRENELDHFQIIGLDEDDIVIRGPMRFLKNQLDQHQNIKRKIISKN